MSVTVHQTPERALDAAFVSDPEMWRSTVNKFLHVGLVDLVNFCAEWYGTEPSPITAEGLAS